MSELRRNNFAFDIQVVVLAPPEDVIPIMYLFPDIICELVTSFGVVVMGVIQKNLVVFWDILNLDESILNRKLLDSDGTWMIINGFLKIDQMS